MFTCSDATQQEIIEDIREQNLDGMVVASCSPKLHLHTFRDVAGRAGLNPYQYVQVNIREQCSWTHTDTREGAAEKAVRLIRAGIARANLAEPLEPIRINTVPRVLVIGAGIAGLRASIGLSDIGISVVLAEKSQSAGGWVAGLGEMYPHGRSGAGIIKQLVDEVGKRDNITLLTEAELVEKSGSIGDFNVKIRVNGRDQDIFDVNVGSIIVSTGIDVYQPAEGEYGYGADGVVSLPEFRKMLDKPGGGLSYKGREIKNIVYIYCVGSRQGPASGGANTYCSRYCCNAAVHSSILAAKQNPGLHQFHLFRDMRTYGRFELLYSEALKAGSRFLRFSEGDPPQIEETGGGKLKVTIRDLLTCGEEIEIKADIVVLVTGMVPGSNSGLAGVLKLPLGKEKFFNEIHPKLRPVETVISGVFICGACQGPKNSAESVASALAAVTQSASILKKGYVELEPLVAAVNPDSCSWCGACAGACPYSAIEKRLHRGREVAGVTEALCRGCGACTPRCPENAINLKGYTDLQVKSMIDALLKEKF
jgi:heterodisulfide reductase subunit A